MEETFGSTCHGAGRARSRNNSRNKLDYQQVGGEQGKALVVAGVGGVEGERQMERWGGGASCGVQAGGRLQGCAPALAAGGRGRQLAGCPAPHPTIPPPPTSPSTRCWTRSRPRASPSGAPPAPHPCMHARPCARACPLARLPPSAARPAAAGPCCVHPPTHPPEPPPLLPHPPPPAPQRGLPQAGHGGGARVVQGRERGGGHLPLRRHLAQGRQAAPHRGGQGLRRGRAGRPVEPPRRSRPLPRSSLPPLLYFRSPLPAAARCPLPAAFLRSPSSSLAWHFSPHVLARL